MTRQPHTIVILLLAVMLTGGLAQAQNQAQPEQSADLLEVEQPADLLEVEPPAYTKGPPLPVHTIFGVGGGSITPVAMILNPGPPDQWYSLPTVSVTYMDMSSKDLQSFVITETLFQKIELGFAATRLGLGNLGSDVRDATGLSIGRSHLFLYSFNARAQIIEENQFSDLMPSVVIGAQIKFNDGVNQINNSLGGALSSIGYDEHWGADFTLTATKTFPDVFGRPLLLTGGMRVSNGAWAGLLGFDDEYHVTAEANVIYMPLDWLWVAFEFRQMPDPYGSLGDLVREPGDWYTGVVGLILSDRLNLTFVYGHLGAVVNEQVNAGLAVQLKYEF